MMVPKICEEGASSDGEGVKTAMVRYITLVVFRRVALFHTGIKYFFLSLIRDNTVCDIFRKEKKITIDEKSLREL